MMRMIMMMTRHGCVSLCSRTGELRKLLRLPAQLFYDGELEAAADEMVVNSLLKWPGLQTVKTPGFPTAL